MKVEFGKDILIKFDKKWSEILIKIYSFIEF